MEQKRPRARHRFDFSGNSRDKEAPTTTGQILDSLNRQAQPPENVGEDRADLAEESAQIAESERQAESSKGRRMGLWLFVGMTLGIVVILWAFGPFRSIPYVNTIGSIPNLVSIIPTIDIMIIAFIWTVALVIGLLGRRARHSSNTSLLS